MHRARRIAAIGIFVTLSGCTALKAVTFQKSEHTGVAPGKLAVGFLPTAGNADKAFGAARHNDKVFGKVLDDSCVPDKEVVAGTPVRKQRFQTNYMVPHAVVDPLVVPIAAAIVQIGVDVLFAELEAKVDALKASATADYGTRMILEKVDWRIVKCLVLVRYSAIEAKPASSDKPPEFIVVMKFTWYPADVTAPPTAFTLQPIYVRAIRSVSVAGKSDPTMDVIFGVGVKAVYAPADDVPRVATIGASAITLRDLKIDEAKAAACTASECDQSELVALPQAVSVVSFGVNVTELGHVGFDTDLAKKQLDAMRSALGPALSEAATIRLTPPAPSEEEQQAKKDAQAKKK